MKLLGKKFNRLVIIISLICLSIPSWCFSACRYRINTYSIDLDGVDDYLYITNGNQTGLDITGSITIEGWVRFDSLPTETYFEESIIVMVSKGNTLYSGGSYELFFTPSSGPYGNVNINFQCRSSLGFYSWIQDDFIAETGVWYHIGATLDVSTEIQTIYWNGLPISSNSYGSSQIYDSDTTFMIGAVASSTAPGGVSNFFDGKIDDVRVWNYARTPEQMTNYKDVPIDIESGLVGSWHFNNDSYIDYSNNENDLTAGGTPSANYLTGYDDKSMDFESSSSQYAYVEQNKGFPNSDMLDITGDFTFEGWFNFESLPAEGDKMYLLSKGEYGVGHCYGWYLENDSGTYKLSTTLFFTSSSAYLMQKDFEPSTATWYHLAVTFDASEHSLQYYVNGWEYGNPLDTVITSIYDDNVYFYIGAKDINIGESYFFDGKIDDLKIWDKVKTREEIDGQKAREIIGNEDNLLAYWKLNRHTLDTSDNYWVLAPQSGPNYLVLVNSPQYSDTVPFIKCRDQLIIF